MQLYIFTPSQRSGYRMVEKQIGTRPRCGSMSLYRYSARSPPASTVYCYNTPNISTRLGRWENRTKLPLYK